MIRGLAALSFLLLAGAAPPEPAAPPDVPGQEIVVRARTDEEVDRFVQALTETRRGRQIARWNDPICPRVIGLDPAHASFVVARIGAVARQFGIPVARGRCHGNIVVVVAGDADDFTAALVRRYPRLFRGARDNLAMPGEIARLLQPRPIRWFAASATGNAEGAPIIDGIARPSTMSRLTETTRENATLAFIIVDSNKLEGLVWRQLAEYLALVALARPAMDASYDSTSLLSIFQMRDGGGQGPRQLTSWDRNLLRGLYATNGALSAARQRASIAAQMEHDVARPDAE
jgi:hypothetical protein